MERRDVFENELTEEDKPSGAQQEDAATEETLDSDVDSEEDDESMSENLFGQNERA